jgi:hypothetical protein
MGRNQMISRKEIDLNNRKPARILANYLGQARNTDIYTPVSSKICSNPKCEITKSIPRTFFEPTAILMTEGAFSIITKDREAEMYGLDMRSDDGEWKFQGLTIAVVRQSINPKKEWIQIV